MSRGAPPSRLDAQRAQPSVAMMSSSQPDAVEPSGRSGWVTGLSWLAGLGMIAGSVVLGAQAGQIRQSTEAEHLELVAGLEQARHQADAAESRLALLPKGAELARQWSSARSAGEQIAAKQQLFLDATAPLDADVLQPETFTRDIGGDLSQSAHDEQVRAYRAERVAQTKRELGMLLDPSVREVIAADGGDAFGPWHQKAPAPANAGALWQWRWGSESARTVDATGRLALVWTLRDGEGSTRMVVRGTYDPRTALVTGLQMMPVREDSAGLPEPEPEATATPTPTPSPTVSSTQRPGSTVSPTPTPSAVPSPSSTPSPMSSSVPSPVPSTSPGSTSSATNSVSSAPTSVSPTGAVSSPGRLSAPSPQPTSSAASTGVPSSDVGGNG